MQEYGCEDCATIGWRRGREAIVQTGEDSGVPLVMRVVRDDDAPGDSWTAECGHKVREGSLLERFFGALPPGQATALPRNG